MSYTASRKAEIVCYLPTLVTSCFQKYQGELLVLWPVLIRAKRSIIGYSKVPRTSLYGASGLWASKRLRGHLPVQLSFLIRQKLSLPLGPLERGPDARV